MCHTVGEQAGVQAAGQVADRQEAEQAVVLVLAVVSQEQEQVPQVLGQEKQEEQV